MLNLRILVKLTSSWSRPIQCRVIGMGVCVWSGASRSMVLGVLCLATAYVLALPVTPGHTQQHNVAVQYVTEQHWKVCERFVKRYTCVVDGDTLWYDGTRMKLMGIDTPEVDGKCELERRLAAEATGALIALLNGGVRSIKAHGRDRYRRPLVTITTDRGDVGQAMIAGGFAMPFGNPDKWKWCR